MKKTQECVFYLRVLAPHERGVGMEGANFDRVVSTVVRVVQFLVHLRQVQLPVKLLRFPSVRNVFRICYCGKSRFSAQEDGGGA